MIDFNHDPLFKHHSPFPHSTTVISQWLGKTKSSGTSATLVAKWSAVTEATIKFMKQGVALI